jgi:hypothetical protein
VIATTAGEKVIFTQNARAMRRTPMNISHDVSVFEMRAKRRVPMIDATAKRYPARIDPEGRLSWSSLQYLLCRMRQHMMRRRTPIEATILM